MEHQRRISPRKRTHSIANKNVDNGSYGYSGSPSKRRKSPLPRCDSTTEREYQSSGKKQRRACWSPIQPYETKGDTKSEFPKLAESLKQRPPAGQMTFDELLAGFKDRHSTGKNESWADMVEEEEEMKGKTENETEKSRRCKPKFVHSEELTKEVSSAVLRIKDANDAWRSRQEQPLRRSQRNVGPTCSSPVSPRRRTSTICSGSSVQSSPVGSPIHNSGSRHGRSRNSFPAKSGQRKTVKERLGEKGSAKQRLGFSTRKDTADQEYRTSHSGKGAPEWFPDKEGWKEPKLGYTDDPEVLARREKDIKKGYETEVYQRYIQEVPKKDRVNGVHPRTPNRYINYSRRSWDTQVRVWRKMLHVFVGEPIGSDASFLSSSDSNYTASSDSGSVADPSEASETSIRTDPDELADILTDYDIDSRRGLAPDDNTMPEAPTGRKLEVASEEDTLTGINPEEGGPVDFSILSGQA